MRIFPDKIMLNTFMVTALLSFSFGGCGDKENIIKVDLNKKSEINNASQGYPIIRIGLIPEQNVRAMAERYEPLANYLSQRLGRKVILVYLDTYGEACDKFIYKQLDAAFFGSLSYALTHTKAGIEPIARPDYNGISTYRGLVIVKKDSPINNVADMKGKKLALVHQATYAGYLYPLYYFKEHGVKDYKTYFSKVDFAGGHDKAIAAVLRGDADVAIAKDLVYQRMMRDNPEMQRQLKIISTSDPVPSNALCVSKEMAPVLKKQMKEILLNMANDEDAKSALESLGAVRFIETKEGDYIHLYEIINALGIDLNTYPYYDRPDLGFGK